MKLLVLIFFLFSTNSYGQYAFLKLCEKHETRDVEDSKFSRDITLLKNIFKTQNCKRLIKLISSHKSLDIILPPIESLSSIYNSVFKPTQFVNSSLLTKDLVKRMNFETINIGLFAGFKNFEHLTITSHIKYNICEIIKSIPSLKFITVRQQSLENIESKCLLESDINIFIQGQYSDQGTDDLKKKVIGIENYIGELSRLHKFKNLSYLGLEDPSSNIDLKELSLARNLTNLFVNMRRIPVAEIRKLRNLKYLTLNCIDFNENYFPEICKQQSINNLDFVESLPFLEGLDLGWNSIKNIESITSLRNLKYLNLRYNQITKLPPPEILSNLIYLNISSNSIEDISTLETAKKLKFLDISRNCVTNQNILKHLSSLEYLKIGGNPLNNLEAIESLHNLLALNLEPITHIDKSRLRRTYLNEIISNLEKDPSKIKWTENFLYEDSFIHSQEEKTKKLVVNIKLEKLTNLRILIASGIRLEPTSNLHKLTNLLMLDLSRVTYDSNKEILLPKSILYLAAQNSNTIESIDFKHLTNLRILDMSYNKQIDGHLSLNLKSLKVLYLNHCKLKKIPTIELLPNLEDLNLEHNSIEEIDIQGHKELVFLDLANNLIQVIPSLNHLPNIYVISLERNPIKSLANIQNPNVVFELYDNPVKQLSSEFCPRNSDNLSVRKYCSEAIDKP